MLSVAYGAASGTLSGACLLLAKSGVELLVKTFEKDGENQFGRWQSWAIVATLGLAAIAQVSQHSSEQQISRMHPHSRLRGAVSL